MRAPATDVASGHFLKNVTLRHGTAREALHPDKNPDNPEATRQFQVELMGDGAADFRMSLGSFCAFCWTSNPQKSNKKPVGGKSEKVLLITSFYVLLHPFTSFYILLNPFTSFYNFKEFWNIFSACRFVLVKRFIPGVVRCQAVSDAYRILGDEERRRHHEASKNYISQNMYIYMICMYIYMICMWIYVNVCEYMWIYIYIHIIMW